MSDQDISINQGNNEQQYIQEEDQEYENSENNQQRGSTNSQKKDFIIHKQGQKKSAHQNYTPQNNSHISNQLPYQPSISKQQQSVSRPNTQPPGFRPVPNRNLKQLQMNREADFFKHNLQIFEKEKLFENLQNAKSQINDLQEENMQLKTQIAKNDKDSEKVQRAIEDIRHRKSASAPGVESVLTIKLRQQIKDTKHDLKQAQTENEKLKKNTKYTKLQEMEVQNNVLEEELQRLRRIIDNLARENRDLFQQKQENPQKVEHLERQNFYMKEQVQELRSDNTQMANMIKNMENKVQYLERQNNQIQKNSQQNQIQNIQYKKMNRDKDQEIEKLKNDIQRFKQQQNAHNSLNSQGGGNKQQMKDLLREIQNLKKEGERKDRIIQDLRAQQAMKGSNTTNRQNSQQQKSQQARPQQQIPSNFNTLPNDSVQRPIQSSQGSRPRRGQQQQQPSNNSKSPNQRNTTGRSQQQQKQPQQQQQQKSQQQQKIKKKSVSKEELFSVLNEIRSSLISMNISFDNIEQIIIPEEIELKGKACYSEIKQILQRSPFSVKQAYKADLLSRYLTEDNSKQQVEFTQTQSESSEKIQEKFKNLIQEYEIFKLNSMELNNTNQEISDILGAQCLNLKRSLEGQSKNGTISCEKLEQCLKSNTIDFDTNHRCYFWLNLYNQNGKCLNNIPIQVIFDFYGLQNMFKQSAKTKSSTQKRPKNDPLSNTKKRNTQKKPSTKKEEIPQAIMKEHEEDKAHDDEFQELNVDDIDDDGNLKENIQSEQQNNNPSAQYLTSGKSIQEVNEAAVLIQKTFRGRAQDKKLEQEAQKQLEANQKKHQEQERKIKEEQEEAAVKIQKKIRTKNARREAQKEVEKKKMEKKEREEQENAALFIQKQYKKKQKQKEQQDVLKEQQHRESLQTQLAQQVAEKKLEVLEEQYEQEEQKIEEVKKHQQKSQDSQQDDDYEGEFDEPQDQQEQNKKASTSTVQEAEDEQQQQQSEKQSDVEVEEEQVEQAEKEVDEENYYQDSDEDFDDQTKKKTSQKEKGAQGTDQYGTEGFEEEDVQEPYEEEIE